MLRRRLTIAFALAVGVSTVALAAARRVGAGAVDELTLVTPLVLADDEAVRLQVTVTEAGEDDRRPVNIYSSRDGDDWTLHASGLLDTGDEGAVDAFSWPPEDAEELDVALFYDRLAEAGYDYGPVFRGLRKAEAAG